MTVEAGAVQQAAATIEVRIERVWLAAEGIRCFELAREDGAPLPAWEPGAHIDLLLAPGLSRSYSLIGPLDDPGRLRVAVALDRASRGGSRLLHEALGPGALLRMRPPRNDFALAEDARHSVLIAGGIGITPLFAMAQRLAALGASWELHYACRTRAAAAFVGELEALCARSGARLALWLDDENEGRPLDLQAIASASPAGAHLYCCGPAPMLDAFRGATASHDPRQVHLEYFRAAEPALGEDGADAQPVGGFVVELARSGVSVAVPPGCTILDALMMNGIDAPYSCYEGLCGTCECKVLEGVPDHRDRLLTEKARAEGSIIICCSGSRSSRLVLDL